MIFLTFLLRGPKTYWSGSPTLYCRVVHLFHFLKKIQNHCTVLCMYVTEIYWGQGLRCNSVVKCRGIHYQVTFKSQTSSNCLLCCCICLFRLGFYDSIILYYEINDNFLNFLLILLLWQKKYRNLKWLSQGESYKNLYWICPR